MTTQLFIENNAADMTADISALLTFALDDIKDFSSRQTTFSKTIVLPGTANNNRIFGHVFQLGSTNTYDASQPNNGYNFNAAKSAGAILFQDNIQTFNGSLRLLTITLDNGRPEYEVALFGNLSQLSVALSPNSAAGKGLLENLDFSEYDHAYTTSYITDSWGNPGGSAYFYPLIDYGNYGAGTGGKHDWKLPTFRPALYVKEYIDKMFKDAGFTYESDIINSTRFKQLIIPHNQKQLIKNVTNFISGGRSTTLTVLSSGTSTNSLAWETITEQGFTSTAGKVFTYTGITSTTLKITFTISGKRKNTSPNSFACRVKVNGTSIASQQLNITGTTTILTPFIWQDDGSFTLTINPTDTIEWNFDATSSGTDATYQLQVEDATLSAVSLSGTPAPVPVAYGDTVSMNDTIPKNIKQVDFLVSIVKLFNLYVYEDKTNPRNILIKPFADNTDTAEYIPGFFVPGTGNAVDWTYKLNRAKPVTISPMSELTSRVYNFKYATDSDYWNDLYTKRYNQNYGDRVFDTEFEFTTDSTDVQLIFAGTPIVGYESEDKVYSTIFKRTGNTMPYTEEQTDSVIRILKVKKIIGISSWEILQENGSSFASPVIKTEYGYAGHLDDPGAPAADLNFGAPAELFFPLVTGDLSNNQFNVYWSPYMAEITDKDSKLVTASFYLTPADIYNLDFGKYVYVDGVLFRLNKIIDYNASNPGDCKVELLRVINTKY